MKDNMINQYIKDVLVAFERGRRALCENQYSCEACIRNDTGEPWDGCPLNNGFGVPACDGNGRGPEYVVDAVLKYTMLPDASKPCYHDERNEDGFRIITVPFGNNYLRILTPMDANYPSEISIDVVDKDGVVVCNLVDIRPAYNTEDEPMFQRAEVRLYENTSSDDEDWTSLVKITIPQEEK